jgi:hypothetical protein
VNVWPLWLAAKFELLRWLLQVLAGLLASLGVSVLAASFDDRLGDESPATETAGTHKMAVQAKRSRTFRINLTLTRKRSGLTSRTVRSSTRRRSR